MALTSQDLLRIDAELDALAPPSDQVERAWASLAETPLGDLALVDGVLDALMAGVVLPTPAAPPERAAAAPPLREPSASVAPEVEVAPWTSPPPDEVEAPDANDAPEGDRALLHDDRPVVSEPEPVAEAAATDELLNPFEEPEPEARPAVRADEFDDDEATMVLDASLLGGLDGNALFDGFVEDAASAPLADASFDARVPALAHRPSSIPPPIPAEARAAGSGADDRPTDIEDLKSYLEDDGDEPDLELVVDDDAIAAEEGLETAEAPADAEASEDSDGDAPKKKGFFKKLFG